MFASLMPIVLALGTTAAIPSIALALYQDKWPVAVMDLVALAWIFAIRRCHRVAYRIRVLHFLTLIFLVAFGLMLAVGPVSLNQLIVEITEGLLVDRLDQTIERMHALTALGLRISVDDFGAGYSSLAYLTRMPLYELKIDKSFISNTPHNEGGAAIVQSILSMARHLGLRVVAEGVETADQAAYLAAHGEACMQGYLFHRPMPPEALLAHLGTTERDFPWHG